MVYFVENEALLLLVLVRLAAKHASEKLSLLIRCDANALYIL